MSVRSYMTPDGISPPYISLQHTGDDPVEAIAVDDDADSVAIPVARDGSEIDRERVRRVLDAIRRARLARPIAA